jgi:uncharacterized membrane protein
MRIAVYAIHVCDKENLAVTDFGVYAGATAVGAVAGLRSMSAPALVSRIVNTSRTPMVLVPLKFLNSPATMKTTLVLAAGELIADKLPFVPNRTSALPLIGRAVTGALSGAAICSARKRKWLTGALLGGAAAVGAAYAAYELRKRVVKRFKLPDAVVALAEDGIVAGASSLILSNLTTNGRVTGLSQ